MQNKKNRSYFFVVLLIALAIKLSLFAYAEIYAPEAKFQVDTIIYLKSGINLVTNGEFAMRVGYAEMFRTPGYPLFLGVLHRLMKIPFAGIILIQISLTIAAVFITYKTAMLIDPRIRYLSALIVLFDPPITIFSLMLITEALFLFLISLVMFVFTLYLKERRIKLLVLSALILAMATYVRPISYYLGAAMGVFIVYSIMRTNFKRSVGHALVFLVIIYSILGLWQFRNYQHGGKNIFTYRSNIDYQGIFRDFSKNDNFVAQEMPPILNSLNVFSRSLMQLMTRPGSLKEFNSPVLRKIGKFFGYPWMAFWLIGFLFGISKIHGNIRYQFLLLVIIYFILVSILDSPWNKGPRFRVPMVPFIAVLSANGWIWIKSHLKKNR